MDKGTLRPLTLHVPYNGREFCRSQLEAHSFSYKPIPTGKKGNALSCCGGHGELQLLPFSSDIFGRGAKGVISPYP